MGQNGNPQERSGADPIGQRDTGLQGGGLKEAAFKEPQKAVCQAALMKWSRDVTALNDGARVAASPDAQGAGEQ